MVPTPPTPHTWTLLLKHHRSTLLLHVDPLQSFFSIKTELLRALHETHSSSRLPTGTSIPHSVSDVIFGEPVDVHDLSRGWKRIGGDKEEEDDEDVLGDMYGAGSRKKGKVAAGKKASASGSMPDDCPVACGLKDGSVLAYKFRDETPDGDEELGIGGEEKWDVVLPSYEDAGEEDVAMR